MLIDSDFWYYKSRSYLGCSNKTYQRESVEHYFFYHNFAYEMNKVVDLHMHTLFSDGQLTPKELIEFAKSRKVQVMCINDHDTVKGVIDAQSIQVDGITVLCGIELSCGLAGESSVHHTGYFPPNTDFAAFQHYLDAEVNQRRQRIYRFLIPRIDRGKKIVDLLIKDGFNITWDEVMDRCKNCLPSRPRIAEVLCAHGYATSVADAFDKYLHNDSKQYLLGSD